MRAGRRLVTAAAIVIPLQVGQLSVPEMSRSAPDIAAARAAWPLERYAAIRSERRPPAVSERIASRN